MTLTTIAAKAMATDTVTLTNYNDIANDINELIGRSGRNLLTNGGFEPLGWQRGVGPFTAAAIFTADRWRTEFGSGTLSITQETTTIDGGSASMKAVRGSHAGTTQIFQTIEDYRALRGKTLSLSLRVHQSVASLITIGITDSAGTTTSSASTTTGSFVTLGVTRTINAATTAVGAMINIGGNGTFYFDNAMLVIGPTPTEYVPLHSQEDLARCQRYFEILHADYIGTATGAGQAFGYGINYRQECGGTPTVTKGGTWGVTNCAQPSVDLPTGVGMRMLRVYTTASAAGNLEFIPNSADDALTVEWNP